MPDTRINPADATAAQIAINDAIVHDAIMRNRGAVHIDTKIATNNGKTKTSVEHHKDQRPDYQGEELHTKTSVNGHTVGEHYRLPTISSSHKGTNVVIRRGDYQPKQLHESIHGALGGVPHQR